METRFDLLSERPGSEVPATEAPHESCGHAASCPDCGDYCIYDAGHSGAHRCGNYHEWW